MCTSAMDVTAVHLLPECYRGSSPRSASTPGPAPDSPASASGRFSASPLLSPCFPYYSHLHGTSTLGLMGLGASFLTTNAGLFTPYGLSLTQPGQALLHSATAAMLPGLSSPPSGLSLSALQRQSPSSSAASRALPFSVENILKPEFGKNPTGTTPNAASELKKMVTSISVSPNRESKSPSLTMKRPLEPAAFKTENKKIKCTEDNVMGSNTLPSTSLKPDPIPVDLTKAETVEEGAKSESELPTDPTKMTDPSKWPAWIFCTRYSDRPSSGPRSRRIKKDRKVEEKRPRTAFTSEQLARLKTEFTENRYLNEKRRQELARELMLHENQIKIWFQNKRAKIKKTTGQKNPLALQLMAQGLYNHSTVPVDEDDDEEYQHDASD